ncbi:hypothetical protein GCM10010245_66340 [Streptomyces spectabilis]|uniref:Uncharacterized protein n=1 Tax=Streptomyces spectabilis TaxID=68270 RepID=A0A7W8B356_STRST|nr:hypothetical protein [Streptomyces spectabilis]GGV42285.1 hypothetical protein GCM10010245_66340 [Streptomyces spectabilis]
MTVQKGSGSASSDSVHPRAHRPGTVSQIASRSARARPRIVGQCDPLETFGHRTKQVRRQLARVVRPTSTAEPRLAEYKLDACQ